MASNSRKNIVIYTSGVVLRVKTGRPKTERNLQQYSSGLEAPYLFYCFGFLHFSPAVLNSPAAFSEGHLKGNRAVCPPKPLTQH